MPDEILSNVLEFAAYHEDGDVEVGVKNTVNAATKLSHVCSRFRTALISTFGLWSRISPVMRSEAILCCFSRCGPAGVQIIISSSSISGAIIPFSRAFAEEAQLWNGFEYACQDRQAKMSPVRVLNLMCIHVTTLDAHAPLLTDLVIHYPNRALKDEFLNGPAQKGLHFYSTWTTSSLRRMVCENFIPVPFHGTESLAYLSVELDFRHHNSGMGAFSTEALASFLSLCPALLDFSFKITSCQNVVAPPPSLRVVMSGVEKVAFSFIYSSHAVVESFLDIVEFPGVNSMKLLCNSRELEDPDSDMQCQKVLQVVFPSKDAFPSLDHLELEICAEGPYDEESLTFVPNRPIVIPFSSVPHIRSLVLTTWATVLEPLHEDFVLPKLTSLNVINCWTMSIGWFGDMLMRVSTYHRDHNEVAAQSFRMFVKDTPWEYVVNHAFGNMFSSRKGRRAVVNLNARRLVELRHIGDDSRELLIHRYVMRDATD